MPFLRPSKHDQVDASGCSSYSSIMCSRGVSPTAARPFSVPFSLPGVTGVIHGSSSSWFRVRRLWLGLLGSHRGCSQQEEHLEADPGVSPFYPARPDPKSAALDLGKGAESGEGRPAQMRRRTTRPARGRPSRRRSMHDSAPTRSSASSGSPFEPLRKETRPSRPISLVKFSPSSRSIVKLCSGVPRSRCGRRARRSRLTSGPPRSTRRSG